jgi:hypothetical protein
MSRDHKCETCDCYDPKDNRPHTGTCTLDGSVVDEKETCWWHSEKGNQKEKEKEKRDPL